MLWKFLEPEWTQCPTVVGTVILLLVTICYKVTEIRDGKDLFEITETGSHVDAKYRISQTFPAPSLSRRKLGSEVPRLTITYRTLHTCHERAHSHTSIAAVALLAALPMWPCHTQLLQKFSLFISPSPFCEQLFNLLADNHAFFVHPEPPPRYTKNARLQPFLWSLTKGA